MSLEHKPEETTAARAPETFQTRMPDSKRTALLRYMIIMFAVAFVLVLLSMVLQTRSSNSTITELHESSTSALTKAKQLQDTNRDLQDQIKQLQKELETQADRIDTLAGDLAAARKEKETLNTELGTVKTQLEAAWKNSETLTLEKANQKAAYASLAVVLMGPGGEGDVEYTRALETLNKNKQYLDPSVVALYENWQQLNSNIS